MYYKQWKKTGLSLCLAAFFMLQMFPAHGYANAANGEPPQTAPGVSSPTGGEASGESGADPSAPPPSGEADSPSQSPETSAPDLPEKTSPPSVTVSPAAPNSLGGIAVDPARAYQQFEGWGTSLAWWGNAVGRWQGPGKQEIIDLLFDPDIGLGLNLVRYNIGGGINPNELSKMRLHADIPSFQPEPGQWTLDADAYQREILQAAMAKGADITEAFSNGPPYWMTYSKSAAGSVLGITNNLYNDAYDDFADYIVRVLRLYKEEYGIEFRTFSPLNEPIDNWWIKGNNQEGCHFDRDKQNLLLKEVASRLRENGLLNTQMSANEEASFENAAKSFLACDDYVKGELAQINVHSYFGTDRKSLRRVAAMGGKRLWVSECGVGGTGSHDHNDITSAMQLTRKILWDLKDLSANGWLYWQAVEDEAGKNNWGFLHANFSGPEEYWLTKQYYTMLNYTKYIRPGCWILEVDDADTLAAYDPQSQRVVLVVTNDSSSPSSKQYDLSGFHALPAQVGDTLRTSSTENAAQVAAAELSGGQLTVELPASSVTTVVLEQCAAEARLKINDSREGVLDNHYQYSGSWKYASQKEAFDSDNHWSNNHQASYSLSFEGSRVCLYGAKDKNNGIAEISVDGAAASDVDLYAPQRQESACYFDSGALPPGRHTVTVKVTGTKNPASSGTFVTADYAEIEGSMQPILPNRAETPLEGNSLLAGNAAYVQEQGQGQESAPVGSATDGRMDTVWSAGSGAQTRLVFPLAAAAMVNEVQVFAPDRMRYKIQVSSDGQTFTDVAAHEPHSTSAGYLRAELPAPVAARYLAVLCLPDSGGSYEIAECKAFGLGYQNVNDNSVGTASGFSYTGDWQYYWFQAGAYREDNHYANRAGDVCRLAFTGPSVTLYGAKDKSHGQAEVFLDGVSQGVVDYYSPTRLDNAVIFTADRLSPGPHVLELRVAGTKNPLSSDYFITVDRALLQPS